MSLFFSVEPGRHGTITNVYAPQVHPIDGLCDVLKAQKKTSAFFYSRGELRDLCRPASLGYSLYLDGWTVGQDVVCDQLTDRTVELLNSADVDFTFLYFGYPDVAGHLQGWMGEEYKASIDRCRENIERLLPVLKDEYAVIITADHGGQEPSQVIKGSKEKGITTAVAIPFFLGFIRPCRDILSRTPRM